MKIVKNVAIIGISGLVGQELLSLIKSENFPIQKLHGTSRIKFKFQYKGNHQEAVLIEDLLEKELDLLFFCGPSALAKKWVPQFLSTGCKIIDLSSAFRTEVPLVIPHINSALIPKSNHISCPNCVAAIMSTALSALHMRHPIECIKGSSYQAVSGGGRRLLERLYTETENHFKGEYSNNALPLHFNVFPHEQKEKEEAKIRQETKILLQGVKEVHINAIRVPTVRAHALSLFIEFASEPNLQEIKNILQTAPGVVYTEGRCTPIDAQHSNAVFVSNLAIDPTHRAGITLWVVGDQLRRGAAWNALEIGQYLYSMV